MADEDKPKGDDKPKDEDEDEGAIQVQIDKPKDEDKDESKTDDLPEVDEAVLTKEDIKWLKAQRKIKAEVKPATDDSQPPALIKVASIKMEKIEAKTDDQPQPQPKPKTRKQKRQRTLKL